MNNFQIVFFVFYLNRIFAINSLQNSQIINAKTPTTSSHPMRRLHSISQNNKSAIEFSKWHQNRENGQMNKTPKMNGQKNATPKINVRINTTPKMNGQINTIQKQQNLYLKMPKDCQNADFDVFEGIRLSSSEHNFSFLDENNSFEQKLGENEAFKTNGRIMAIIKDEGEKVANLKEQQKKPSQNLPSKNQLNERDSIYSEDYQVLSQLSQKEEKDLLELSPKLKEFLLFKMKNSKILNKTNEKIIGYSDKELKNYYGILFRLYKLQFKKLVNQNEQFVEEMLAKECVVEMVEKYLANN